MKLQKWVKECAIEISGACSGKRLCAIRSLTGAILGMPCTHAAESTDVLGPKSILWTLPFSMVLVHSLRLPLWHFQISFPFDLSSFPSPLPKDVATLSHFV